MLKVSVIAAAHSHLAPLLALFVLALGGCTASARAEQYNERGEVDLERGEVDQAMVAFNRALELRPGYAAAHRNIGRALFMKNDPAGAEKALREAIRLDPREARALTELGRALSFDRKRRAEGLQLCESATGIRPDLASAWACVCAASGMSGETKKAIAACARAIQLDPDGMTALVHGSYGRALEAAGRLEEAGRAYSDAIRADSETPQLLYRLAGIQARTGKESEAVQTLLRALELDPKYRQAHRTLAQYYILERNVEMAKKYVNSATALGEIIPRPLFEQYQALLAENPGSESGR